MKNLKHFIWDYDGTLMDTYPRTVSCFCKALEDFGKTAEPVEVLEKMMETIPFAVNYYSEFYNLPELQEHFSKYRSEMPNTNIKIFPGIPEVLKRIKELGAHNYIFTHSGKSIYPFLDKFGIREYFTEIVTNENEHFKLKPAPDVIIYLMEKYGGTLENTAMVGDRRCDLESGYNAGCKAIHLLTPSVPQYPPCDWQVSNFNEMLEMLK